MIVGGPLVCAKLFDLIVVTGAWSANPPQSLKIMPYEKAWPIDTGLLCIPSVGILLLLVLTVVAFWPMNAVLFYHGMHSSKDTISNVQSLQMARRWVELD